ncbi:MAG: hypothetical protein V7L20_31440 [Nostoc sp.]|uniref:hypothetical protein n=1 Tax=Nostoc sp. TaxID=1180 RepID=UPI002FFA6A56
MFYFTQNDTTYLLATEELKSGYTVGQVFVDNRSVNFLLVESGNTVVDRES